MSYSNPFRHPLRPRHFYNRICNPWYARMNFEPWDRFECWLTDWILVWSGYGVSAGNQRFADLKDMDWFRGGLKGYKRRMKERNG